jgi:protein-disulfide isomerase
MWTIPKTLIFALLMANILSCQRQDAVANEEPSAIKQDIAQLRQELALIGEQIGDIHKIATASQRPQFRSLPTQNDLDGNGLLAVLGDPQAKLAILEFSDFQCPYCKRYLDQAFPRIKSQYIDTGKLKYLVRDSPLSFHKKAQGAAVAANCAARQDAYWSMRDALFANMSRLGDALYQETASNLSLDIKAFNACLTDEAIAAKITADMAYGASMGVSGTPSFIIGRVQDNRLLEPKLVVGAQKYETFAELLDSLLAQ